MAYPAFRKGEYFFPHEQLVENISDYLRDLPQLDPAVKSKSSPDSYAILRAIEAQHGILVECAYRVHTFAHLTFQEYYAARYIFENANEHNIRELLNHALESRWREVIILAASMLHNANLFFTIFAGALDKIVEKKPHLIEFLTCVERKASETGLSYDPAAIRAYYILCELKRVEVTKNQTRTSSHSSAEPGIVNQHVLEYTRKLIRNLGHTFENDYKSAHDLAADLSQKLTNAAASARALARERVAIWGNLAYDRLLRISNTLLYTSKLIESSDIIYLSQALVPILSVIPTGDASPGDWYKFVEKHHDDIDKHAYIKHEWKFTEAQMSLLENYLVATQLFLDCLEVARVTNRAAIEARLLLPPAA